MQDRIREKQKAVLSILRIFIHQANVVDNKQ